MPKPKHADIVVTLKGSPEQIRLAYRTVLDSLDDMTDIYHRQGHSPHWNCTICHTDDNYKRPPNQEKRRKFLMAEMDGFIDRPS